MVEKQVKKFGLQEDIGQELRDSSFYFFLFKKRRGFFLFLSF